MSTRPVRIYRLVTLLVAAFAATVSAESQSADGPPPGFEIKNENALLNLSGVPTGPGNLPAAALLTVGGQGNPNQAFQTWWWYRLPGGTRELAVNAANPVWTPDGANRVTGNFALSPTLAAVMEWSIFGLGNNSGILQGALTVRNNGAAATTLQVFHYLDLDLGGTKNDDGATRVQAGQPNLLIGDGNWLAEYRGIQTGFTHFASDAFPSVRDLLTNNAVDDFPDAQAAFATTDGDWTGGFEWERNIAANATAGFTFTVRIRPRPASEAGTLWLMLLGMAALAIATSSAAARITRNPDFRRL